jgi:hypothetical protein
VKPVDLPVIQSPISNFHIKNAIPLQDSVVLIFPGAAGPDSSTQLLKDRILKSDEKNGNLFELLTFSILNFVLLTFIILNFDF